MRTDNPQRLTDHWDHRRTRRPATLTMGLTGSAGVYAGWSRCAAHGAGGFTLYRPGHWSLRGTGLGYGDVLGKSSNIFAYEVDGIDYTMTHGLPYPSVDAALAGPLTIIALSPATTLAHSTSAADQDAFIGSEDAEELANSLFGKTDADSIARVTHGNGAIVEYRRGKGAILNAGSCEWVAGLIYRDEAVQTATRNILKEVWE